MLKRKHISLLFVLLVAVFALCTATKAVAGIYHVTLDGNCNDDDPYTCSVSAGGWVIEIIPGTSPAHAGEFPVYCSGADTNPECVDKKGNPITGYRFAYEATSPVGTKVVQADVLASICTTTITKTYPNDQSVKFLSVDPNTGYAGGTSDFVIAWTGLKLDPSNKMNFSVYTTKAGAGPQGAQLQTGMGLENFNNLLGPVCCAPYAAVVTSRTVGNTTTTYDSCSGNLESVSASDSSPITQVPGLYVCWSTGGFNSQQCEPIKRMGPSSGAYLDVSTVQGNPGDPYTGTRYYGYGTQFYKQSISGTIPGDCQDIIGPALVDDSITFDNAIVVNYKKCGDIGSVTSPDGTQAIKVNIWIFEADAHGKMTTTGGLVVNSGPRNGAIAIGSCYSCLGGTAYKSCSFLCPCY